MGFPSDYLIANINNGNLKHYDKICHCQCCQSPALLLMWFISKHGASWWWKMCGSLPTLFSVRSVHFKIIICFRLEILPELQHTSVEGGQIKDWEIRIKREDTVKVALSVQEKLKGMKYSTVKDRRQFYYTDLDTWFLKIEWERRERERWLKGRGGRGE